MSIIKKMRRVSAQKTRIQGLVIIFLSFFLSFQIANAEENILKNESTNAVIFSPARYSNSLKDIQEELDVSVAKLQKTLGISEWKKVEVWLLPSVHTYFKIKNRPSLAPEWAAGLSLSDKGIIIIANGVSPTGEIYNIRQTLRHELAHVAIDRAKKGEEVPRWFHEGFAVFFADEWTVDRSENLSTAAAGRNLKKFKDLERSFPSHKDVAGLAYNQSFHFVRHLKKLYGDDVYLQVLQGLDEEMFALSFQRVTGHSLAFVEAKWKQDLEKGQSLWSIFSDSNILFFGATLLFVVAFLIRRRRKKSQLMQMQNDLDWDYDASRYPLPGSSSEKVS